jgi:hypothetical protein
MPQDTLGDLITLFTIEKKQALKQHSRIATITRADLASFILTAQAGELPWRHLAHHRNFVPEHLSLTDKDLAALATTIAACCRATCFSMRTYPIGISSILTNGILPVRAITGAVGHIFILLIDFGLAGMRGRSGKTSARPRTLRFVARSTFASGIKCDTDATWRRIL